MKPSDAASSDADVIRRSLKSPELFAIVFDRYQGAVHAYAARRVGRDAADDVLSDVFLAAFSQRPTFDLTVDSARPWLYGIARNLLLRRWRAVAAHGRLTNATASVAVGSSVPHEDLARQLDAEAEWSAVRVLLEELPEGDREALLLYAWEELTYTQIATAMAIPVGTVRSRIHRSRTYLRDSLTYSQKEKWS